ncbi:MAG: hypothetical protein U0Q16_08805 [Bryobacteraceae bacterium]
MDEIQRFIGDLVGPLLPNADVARRHLPAEAEFDAKSGALRIDRRPKIAPEAYCLVLYPGISERDQDRYRDIQVANRRGPIPAIAPEYKAILAHLNGAFLFQASLFGIPRSMLRTPPLLDRSTLQPIDLLSSNIQSRYGADPGLFHFGAGPFTDTENVGYFCDAGRVKAYLRGGRLLHEYASFREFFTEELMRLKSIYPG